MLFGYDILRLTPLHRRDELVVLVPFFKALHLCREEGCDRLPVREALWHFESATTSMMGLWATWEIRVFLGQAHLPGLFLPDTEDSQLIPIIAGAIKTGDLVALRKGDKAGKPVDATTEQRRLVRNIDKQTRGRLNFSGRSYKLVADVDLAGVPGRDSYEVVGHDDAIRVLDGLAKQSATGGDLSALLAQASAKLTPDWRPPFHPDGLILLRRIIARAAANRDDEPAITPSQMRAMMEKAALEIHVVDLNQKPQEGLAFKIAMPDGGSVSDKLDKDGRGRAKSSSPGVFTVSFPDLDGADWDGDGALDLPKEERSEASKYKVKQGDRLPTIARKKGFARWETIWDFAGNAALKELRSNAHVLFPDDEVSIPSKLSRVAEVQGGAAEYVVRTAPEMLRVRFAEFESMDGDPVMFRATPDAGNDLFEGELADDGTMEIDLPPDTTKVVVELFCGDGDDPFVTYEFDVGDMDPLTEVTGIQARLANLGYYDGAIDGDAGDVTKSAVARFRRDYGVPLSDEVDDNFKNALRWVHDDDDDTQDCEADQTAPEDSTEDEENEPSDDAGDAEDVGVNGEDLDDSVDEDPVKWDDDGWEEEDETDGSGEDEDSGEVTP